MESNYTNIDWYIKMAERKFAKDKIEQAIEFLEISAGINPTPRVTELIQFYKTELLKNSLNRLRRQNPEQVINFDVGNCSEEQNKKRNDQNFINIRKRTGSRRYNNGANLGANRNFVDVEVKHGDNALSDVDYNMEINEGINFELNLTKANEETENEITEEDMIEGEIVRNSFLMRAMVLHMGTHVWTSKPDFRADFEDVKAKIEKLINVAKDLLYNSKFDEADAVLARAEKLYEDVSEILFKKTNTEKQKHATVKYKVTVKGDQMDIKRCIKIAENALFNGDLKKAERLLLKAERICPTENARKLLKEVEAAKLALVVGAQPQNVTQETVIILKQDETNENDTSSTDKPILDPDHQFLESRANAVDNPNSGEAEEVVEKPIDVYGSNDKPATTSVHSKPIDKIGAIECVNVAKDAIHEKNFNKAERLLFKAQCLDPDIDVHELVMKVQTEVIKSSCERETINPNQFSNPVSRMKLTSDKFVETAKRYLKEGDIVAAEKYAHCAKIFYHGTDVVSLLLEIKEYKEFESNTVTDPSFESSCFEFENHFAITPGVYEAPSYHLPEQEDERYFEHFSSGQSNPQLTANEARNNENDKVGEDYLKRGLIAHSKRDYHTNKHGENALTDVDYNMKINESINFEDVAKQTKASEETENEITKEDRIEGEIVRNAFQMRAMVLHMGTHVWTSKPAFCADFEDVKAKIEKWINVAKALLYNSKFGEADFALACAEKLYEEVSEILFKKTNTEDQRHATRTAQRDISATYVKVTVKGDQMDVKRCIKIAENALSNGDLKKAERLLLKAERIYPTENARKLLKDVEVAKLALVVGAQPQNVLLRNFEHFSSGQSNPQLTAKEARNNENGKAAEDYLKRGLIALSKRDYHTAERYAVLSEKIKPSVRAKSLISIVCAYFTLFPQDITMAIDDKKKARKKASPHFCSNTPPRHPATCSKKNKAEDVMDEAEKAFIEGKLDDAESLVRKAKSFYPTERARDLSKLIQDKRRKETCYSNHNISAADTKPEVQKCETRAQAAYENGEFDKAEHMLIKAYRMLPSAKILSFLEKVRTERANKEAETKSEVQKCTARAKAAYENGEFDKAEHMLLKAYEMLPSEKILSFLERVRTERVNKEAETKSEVQKCTARAQAAYENGEFDKAEHMLLKAYEMLPSEKILSFLERVRTDRDNKEMEASKAQLKPEDKFDEKKEEAGKCYDIAVEAFKENNLEKSERFLLKANRMYPTKQTNYFLTKVMKAKEKKIKEEEEAAKLEQAAAERRALEIVKRKNLQEKLIQISVDAITDHLFYAAQSWLQKAHSIYPNEFIEGLLIDVQKKIQAIENSNIDIKKRQEEESKMEAEKCLAIAESYYKSNDLNIAKSFVLLAEFADPSGRAKDILQRILDSEFYSKNGKPVGLRGAQYAEFIENLKKYKADCFLKIGEDAYKDGNYKLAEEYFNKSNKTHPSVKAENMLLKAYRMLPSDKIVSLLERIRAERANKQAQTKSEVQKRTARAQAAYENGEFDKAEHMLLKAYEMLPSEKILSFLERVRTERVNKEAETKSEVQKCTARAQAAYENGEFDKAEHMLLKAYRMSPSAKILSFLEKVRTERANKEAETKSEVQKCKARAKAAYENGEFDKAEHMLLKAYRMLPSAKILSFLEKVRTERVNKEAETKSEVQKCTARAQAAYENGEFHKAEHMLLKAYRMLPSAKILSFLEKVRTERANKEAETKSEVQKCKARAKAAYENGEFDKAEHMLLKAYRMLPSAKILSFLEKVRTERVNKEAETKSEVQKCTARAQAAYENGEFHKAEHMLLKAYRMLPSAKILSFLEKVRTERANKEAETKSEVQKCKARAKAAYENGEFDKAEHMLLKAYRMSLNDKILSLLERVRAVRANKEMKASRAQLKPEDKFDQKREEAAKCYDIAVEAFNGCFVGKQAEKGLAKNANRTSTLGNILGAEKCVERAEAEFAKGSLGRAERLLLKAERLCPTIRAKDLLGQVRERRCAEPTPEQVEAINRVKNGKDDYDVLGIEKKGCTISAVRKAYRRLTLLLHPD